MPLSDMTGLEHDIAAVLAFWFEDLSPSQWFDATASVDAACRDRFAALHDRLASHVPLDWLATPEGCLAAVIVLDQFPRNMYRGNRRAFDSDKAALAIAKYAIDRGFDKLLDPMRTSFLYMPFQHAEDPKAQARSVELFARLGNAEILDFARRHKAIIDRFGRFPHRNEILGRSSSQAEKTFLETPGSSF